ncbi:MAG TPA: pimeloyl-ACP methyl ester esterase BioH [Burkholderiales bacterium]|nr:pimeloyl-ACP methyl ester esterase BioH [Burkholderiales bacterium]
MTTEAAGRSSPCRDVVLLHGWGMAKSVWREVSRLLSTHCRVTALDLPGYGASDSCRPYTLERITEQLAVQAPQRCAVVGWSLGGQIALHWARQCPEQVNRIGLVAATPRFVTGLDWPHGVEARVLDDFRASLRAHPEDTLARFALLQAQGDRAARDVARQLRAHAIRPEDSMRATLEDGLANLRDNDLREQLKAVTQPALVLQGEEDALVPPSVAEYLSAALPHARLVTLPGVAHAPLVSVPGAVAHELLVFLHE